MLYKATGWSARVNGDNFVLLDGGVMLIEPIGWSWGTVY